MFDFLTLLDKSSLTFCFMMEFGTVNFSHFMSSGELFWSKETKLGMVDHLDEEIQT